ncbi:DDE_3 domain-containing protein [Trichonephila clavipes]|nr:DDE_3 domain-containing protein [Trichonephila clavipes]
MVWGGAIAYDSWSTLIVMRGTFTGQRYVDDILRPLVGPFLNGLPGAILQQDNARPHTARIAQDFLRQLEVVQRAMEVAQYLCRCTPCIRLIVLFLRSSESLICVIMCTKFHFNTMLSSWVAIFNVPECILHSL